MQNASVQVLLPTLTQNPHYPSQTSVDWSDAEAGSTVAGAIQPANAEVVQAAGLDAKRDLQQLYAEPVALAPEGRVLVDGVMYRVLRVREYASHTSALLEAVDDPVGSGSAS